MAKKTKNEQTNGATPGDEAAASSPATEITPAAKTRARVKPAGKAVAKKTGAKKSSSRPPAKKKQAYEPSDADVRLRAYFIAERRVQLALHGDPSKDWLEARQQLLEEAAQRHASLSS